LAACSLLCLLQQLHNLCTHKDDNEQRLKVKQMDHATCEERIQQVGCCW
jgi:hypothetical protein